MKGHNIDRVVRGRYIQQIENIIFPLQSIIITVADGEEFVAAAMKSVLDQEVDPSTQLECVVFLDDCKDKTADKLSSYEEELKSKGIALKMITNESARKGVGYGRNRAIEASRGEYLCFLDIDDVMYPRRVSSQLRAAKLNHNAVSDNK